MDITFKKKKKSLEGQVTLKSLDLEERSEDFHPDIEPYAREDKFITISPECVRCNLCAEECPVNAIRDANSSRKAKILENCVKCEICAQTCPVGAIHVIESKSEVDEEVDYHLREIKVPHRKLRKVDIKVDPKKCQSHEICTRFCPTSAIKVPKKLAQIDQEACVGCGSCANLCPEDAITLERELGPVIKTKQLIIDQETCVQCQVCEENCPVDAIKLDEDYVKLDKEKCILCEVCSRKCPVGAIELERLPE
jgi:ferredoxin